MNGARKQLFPGAGLAADQDRDVAMRSDPRRLVERLPQGGAPAEDRLEAESAPLRLGEPAGLDPAARLPRLPLERAAQEIEVLRQREIVACAPLHGRRRHSVIRHGAHEIDRRARGRQIREQIERRRLRTSREDQQDRRPHRRGGILLWAPGHDPRPKLPRQLGNAGAEAVRELHEGERPGMVGHAPHLGSAVRSVIAAMVVRAIMVLVLEGMQGALDVVLHQALVGSTGIGTGGIHRPLAASRNQRSRSTISVRSVAADSVVTSGGLSSISSSALRSLR